MVTYRNKKKDYKRKGCTTEKEFLAMNRQAVYLY
jgi:hypothetical protein